MATAVRVVSYNVHGLRDDRQALVSVIRDLAPDVVMVQEAPRRLRWRARCAQIARSWGMLYAVGGLPSLGNLIVVSHRIRVIRAWSIRFPLTPGRHMRGAAFARCGIRGSTFMVAGSHLSTDLAERPEQAMLLDHQLGATDGPMILGCDLNETASGASWKRLAARLVDTGAEADVATFPASAPTRRIDAVFASADITVTSLRVVTGDAAGAASDHRPVVADLLVP